MFRFLSAFIVVAASSGSHAVAQHNTLTADERAAGWQLLFDGQTLSAWRGFKQADMPAGWSVRDGTILRTGPGGDILTREVFGDFELTLEWNVAPGGNSGIFFRVTEDAGAVYETGPEMQVLDDAHHADGESALTSAGSNFGLHPAPRGVVKPAGQWNRVRLRVEGAHVEHWLNDVRVAAYELWSPEWEALVSASKFAAWPGYGRATRGHVALQDHGDEVAYRNIKIRPLP